MNARFAATAKVRKHQAHLHVNVISIKADAPQPMASG
jgi:hypothetical protein